MVNYEEYTNEVLEQMLKKYEEALACTNNLVDSHIESSKYALYQEDMARQIEYIKVCLAQRRGLIK